MIEAMRIVLRGAQHGYDDEAANRSAGLANTKGSIKSDIKSVQSIGKTIMLEFYGLHLVDPLLDRQYPAQKEPTCRSGWKMLGNECLKMSCGVVERQVIAPCLRLPSPCACGRAAESLFQEYGCRGQESKMSSGFAAEKWTKNKSRRLDMRRRWLSVPNIKVNGHRLSFLDVVG